MLTYCDVIDTKAGRQQLWRHNDRLFPRGFFGRVLTGFDYVALSRTRGTVPLMNSMHGFGTELIRNLAIWLAESQDYHLFDLRSLLI